MEEKKNLRLPTSVRRILWIILALIIIGLAAFVTWYVIHYRNYTEYRSLVTQPEARIEAEELKKTKDPENRVPGFEIVAENDGSALFLKRDNAEVALYDKATGNILYSNPQDASKDTVARSGVNQENLKSQFVLSYLDKYAKEGTAWNSYGKATANGQVEFQQIENGLRVVYTLSDQKIVLAPNQLTAEWYAILAESGKKQVTKTYELDEESGLYKMKTQGVSSRHKLQVDADARAAGFTIEDLEEMNALVESEEEEETSENISFVITLEYRLNDKGLEVTLPHNGLEEHGGAQIRAIQLLPFVGAANAEEQGYLVVPDGSGAIIRFNNGKSGNAQYNQNIYDLDLVDSDFAATQNTQTARMALFGICRENSSVLVTCERGATLGSIIADVAGRNNSYNFAYFAFNLRRTDTLVVAGEDAIVAEKNLYPVDCKVQYTLLGEEYKGYSGIARAYRERLQQEGKWTAKAETTGDIPFYYDVIGGVKETAHFLGIQYLRVLPMTTFAQAEQIMTELKHENIVNQRMNFQGWMNGGYYHDPVSGVSVLGQLGGENGLKHLQQALKTAGGALYPDASLQFVTSIAKGFYASEEASRYYAEGYVVELGVINPVSLRRTATLGFSERGYMLLSPKFLPRYAKSLADAADRLGLDTLSLRDLASEVHADKRRNEVINREAALDIVKNAFETIKNGNRELMVSGGNDYSFPYASHVLNAPLEATMFPIIDEQVPLWEMILHGAADYCGSDLNLMQSDSPRKDLLHLVEYGASTRFVFTWRDAAEMKYTGVNNYFATQFTSWKEEAAESYRFVNNALKYVSGAEMTAHEKVEEGLMKVSYSNGVTIWVNYTDRPASAEGKTVPAMEYLVEEGDAK